MKKIVLIVISILLVSSCLSLGSPLRAQTPADQQYADSLPANVALQVENETVPMDVFNRRVESLLESYKKNADKKGQKYDSDKVRDRLQQKVKNRIVSRLVLKIYAERSDVTVPDEKIQKKLDRAIQKAGSREKFKDNLEEKGSSIDDVRNSIRKNLRIERYVRENIPEVTVSDTEIQEIYLNNKDQFQQVSAKRAYRFIKRRLHRKKENHASKVLVGKLKEKSDIRLHPSLRE